MENRNRRLPSRGGGGATRAAARRVARMAMRPGGCPTRGDLPPGGPTLSPPSASHANRRGAGPVPARLQTPLPRCATVTPRSSAAGPGRRRRGAGPTFAWRAAMQVCCPTTASLPVGYDFLFLPCVEVHGRGWFCAAGRRTVRVLAPECGGSRIVSTPVLNRGRGADIGWQHPERRSSAPAGQMDARCCRSAPSLSTRVGDRGRSVCNSDCDSEARRRIARPI